MDDGNSDNDVPTLHRTTYRICVWRPAIWMLRRLSCAIVASLAVDGHSLAADARCRLDLQPLLDRCYEMGSYDLDYRADPEPPLDAENASKLSTNGCAARDLGNNRICTRWPAIPLNCSSNSAWKSRAIRENAASAKNAL